MTIQSILGAIVIGAVIGALGRLLLPGRQAIGWILTIVVGIVAASIGTLHRAGTRRRDDPRHRLDRTRHAGRAGHRRCRPRRRATTW